MSATAERSRPGEPEAPRPRCAWARDPQFWDYHDREWGVPSHDDRHLFEMLILEGAQAGLSWSTILRKRDTYRAAFADFDAARVAAFDEREVARLLADPGIVRNRAKVRAAIGNARAVLEVVAEHGSLDAYLWSFVGGRTIRNRPRTLADVPPRSEVSDRMSKALLARGFKFVGSTICYAFLQATGMVDDHTVDCFRSRELQ